MTGQLAENASASLFGMVLARGVSSPLIAPRIVLIFQSVSAGVGVWLSNTILFTMASRTSKTSRSDAAPTIAAVAFQQFAP